MSVQWDSGWLRTVQSSNDPSDEWSTVGVVTIGLNKRRFSRERDSVSRRFSGSSQHHNLYPKVEHLTSCSPSRTPERSRNTSETERRASKNGTNLERSGNHSATTRCKRSWVCVRYLETHGQACRREHRQCHYVPVRRLGLEEGTVES